MTFATKGTDNPKSIAVDFGDMLTAGGGFTVIVDVEITVKFAESVTTRLTVWTPTEGSVDVYVHAPVVAPATGVPSIYHWYVYGGVPLTVIELNDRD